MKRVPLLVGLATCAFVVTQMSPTAQAQIIPLPRAEIEDRIEMAMECYLHPDGPGCYPDCDRTDPTDPDCPSDSKPDCPLYWAADAGSDDRVQVSRKNATTLNADVHLKCSINDFADPDVYIHLDLVFSCFWVTPSVKVSPADVDIEVDWPWYIDVATLSATWWAGNIESRTATSTFRASGAVQDFTEERMVPVNYCPGIAVQSNGDVEIDLALGTECTNGQTKHRSCSGNYIGPGYDYVCVGGRWGDNGGWCEPKPPPGGEQP
jgi:hypothetical protein